MNHPKIFFRIHAVKRMFERDVSVKNVLRAIEMGETIEDYSLEMPEPSRLILGFQGKRPFHAVISESKGTSEITVITVYTPSSDKWSKDFKHRQA